MSNGEWCCLFGVCCPPAVRKAKVTAMIAAQTGLTIEQAGSVFDLFDANVDFAPKGLLQPLIDHVADQARTHPKE